MRLIGRIGNYVLYSDRLLKDGSGRHEEQLGDQGIPDAPGTFTFDYGPATGGLLESVRIRLNTFGEYIRKASVVPHKQRTVSVTQCALDDALLKIERVNGSFSASHTIAFLTAFEKACGIDVEEHVQLARVVQIELERMRNHIFLAQRLAEAAGFSVPSAELFYLVERVNRVIGRAFGHRYFYGVNSCARATMLDKVDVGELNQIVAEFRQIQKGILENRIFIDRLQGTGAIKKERSTGPCARAAGYGYDARLDGDYSAIYSRLGYRLTKHDSGDAFGRLLVRCEEVESSLEVLSSASTDLDSRLTDHLRARVEHTDIADVEASAVGRVESPSGDIAYLVGVNEGKLSEVALLSPSAQNVELFCESTVGNVFTDLPFNWESFGIWMSEVGVIFI